jgi:septal ring factor EnvC (AmiA/AmiB activator)
LPYWSPTVWLGVGRGVKDGVSRRETEGLSELKEMPVPASSVALSKRSGFGWAAGSIVLLLLASPAIPQSLTTEANQRLKASQDRLSEANRRELTLKADVSKMDEERGKLNAQLQDTARLVQSSETQMTRIEERLDELEAQRKLYEGSLAQRQAAIASLLSALQRMGRNPPPVIITRRQDALSMVRSAMLLARAHPEIQAQATDLATKLTDLDRVIGDIKAQGDKLRAEKQRLAVFEMRLSSLMETKRQSLSERQNELEAVKKEALDAAQRVNDVSQLIAVLNETVSRTTGLGGYEKEIATAEIEGKNPQSKGTQVAIAVPQVPRSPTVELAPAGGPLGGSPGRMKPAILFHLAKAQLPLPASGRRIVSFGETTSSSRKSQGIVIETRHNARITSPCDGWIVYAGEFRSYGQLLIINAGGGYHVLLAGLSHIDAQLGQFVLGGEPVGTMSAAPKGKAQDNAPVLYIEFRKEGRPIDPDPWWHDGQQKVQG